MRGAEALIPPLIGRPGAMHHATRHRMDRRANGGGEIDAVVEVPLIGVDPRTEGRVHLIRHEAPAEGPDEMRLVLSAIRRFLMIASWFFTHLSLSPFRLINAVSIPAASIYAGAITVTVPFEPLYLSAPSSTYKIPPPAGLTDGATEASRRRFRYLKTHWNLLILGLGLFKYPFSKLTINCIALSLSSF